MKPLMMGFVALAMFSVGGGVGKAQARVEANSIWAGEIGPAQAPSGYVTFCRTTPQECTAPPSAAEQLTQDRWRELREANRLANVIVEPQSDFDHYGVAEVWAVPGSYGDCEDYVLLKRKWLIQKGWPAGTLLITVVLDELGEGHAVLLARTSGGDLVLDNKTDDVRLWSQTPYLFVKRQSASNPSQWAKIGKLQRNHSPTPRAGIPDPIR